jgi:hypothetical protein
LLSFQRPFAQAIALPKCLPLQDIQVPVCTPPPGGTVKHGIRCARLRRRKAAVVCGAAASLGTSATGFLFQAFAPASAICRWPQLLLRRRA